MSTFINNLSLTDASVALYGFKSQAIVGTLSATNWTIKSSGTGNSGIWTASGDAISAASVLLTSR